jgi:3-oxoacyl-[acyl-carrier-protein] synthase-1
MTIYLNDFGILCALGHDKRSVLRGLLAGDVSGMRDTGPLLTGRSSLCGTVDAALIEVPEQLAEFDCRNNRLLATALAQIDTALDAAIDRYGRDRIAVVIGTSTSGIAALEAAWELGRGNQLSAGAYHYRAQEIGSPAEFAARYLGLTGPRYTVSTACSSSAKAVIAAARLIRSGRCDAAISGGADNLCKLTLNGFDSLQSLAAGRCNPFSRNRDGINIGEGAGVFLISGETGDVALLGHGESSDAYHMAAPEPDGRGAAQAMQMALASAGLSAAEIDYINLHGTATSKNDEMEGKAVFKVFGSALACSSTKTQLGHCLGAAGALELVATIAALRAGFLPATLNLRDSDPECDLDYVPLEPRSGVQVRTFLSNSFAFGGSNAVLAARIQSR